MAKIQPGTYEARVSDYGIGTTNDGNAQVMVLLAYKDQTGENHEVTWFGTLKEGKGREITLKALLTMGFAGDDVAALAEGIHSNLLDAVTPVSIVLEEHTYNDKKSIRVQWINSLGGKMMEKRIEKSQAKLLLGALNLKGDLAMLRSQQPKAPQKKTAGSHPFAPNSDIDTGFDPGSDFGL
jgi:hypothetical protein